MSKGSHLLFSSFSPVQTGEVLGKPRLDLRGLVDVDAGHHSSTMLLQWGHVAAHLVQRGKRARRPPAARP
jgi:hypothetical protein